MKNFLKDIKISKKTVTISSVLLVLVAIPAIYFLTKDNGEVKSWYSSSWLYRRAITINNPGGTLTNEDILIQIDTQSLVTGGKLQSNCNDLRFTDSDDSTLLSYWIEDGCNTAQTNIWIKIPSLPSGDKTIYIYYGNTSATKGSLTWAGNIYMYADTTCPAGWTRASDLDNKFLYGSSTYGSTGGADTHTHVDAQCTTSSISTTSLGAINSGTSIGTTTSHTHQSLKIGFNSTTNIPPYTDMIVCYNNHFLLSQGLISLFSNTVPSGWTRFSNLDGRFPRAAASYAVGTIAATHSHNGTYGYVSTTTTGTALSSLTTSATGGTITYSGGYTIHTFTSGGTFSVANDGIVEVLVVAGGGGGGRDRGGGGGSGGIIYNSALSITSGSIAITVGGGGAGSTSNNSAGQSGGSSSFGSYITASGGGGGGSLYATGVSGGSGGGGGAASGYTTPGSGTSGQGNSGGQGKGDTVPFYGGGGGGKGTAGTAGTAGTNPGKGGDGSSYSISGTATYYGGGGGGRGANGGLGGGGNGGQSVTDCTVQPTAGTNGRGGGGGAGCGNGSYANGATGGSGIVIIRYPTSTGPMASNTHTHTSVSSIIPESSNIPPYITMIFGKANSSTYATNDNILMTSSLPPLGWNRVTTLDSKFAYGGSTYGTTGGTESHTHNVTITSSGPSATVQYRYGSGGTFADTSHTHSCTTTTNSVSNLPQYISVIYTQRKASLATSVNTEEIYNQPPTAPTSLQTNNTTNPVGVVGTPVFNAIFQDPDSGNTAIYYQIQVNTASNFGGTMMWDSTKTTLSPALAIGARMPNKTYAGTTLSNGTTYYWRIKFWDNYNTEGAWSSTAQFTMNTPPTAPTSLQTESATNPTGVTDTTPEFSAVFNDPNTGDTGTYYEIQVNTLSDFTGTVMWNSGQTSMTPTFIGSRSPQISYAGTALTLNGATYYWRIRFTDNYGTVGEWSPAAQFTIIQYSTEPSNPSNLFTDGETDPNNVNNSTPEFSAIFNDSDIQDAAIYYQIQVNTEDTFTEEMVWDSGKTAITGIPSGTRSPNISYAGNPLTTNTIQYKWRIKFWDSADQESPWSDIASFRIAGAPNIPSIPQVDGLNSGSVIHRSNPTFSAIYSDNNMDNGIYYEIEVNTLSNFSGNVMWDTGKVSITPIASNTRSPEIQYAGFSFTPNATYYWRIRFWDEQNNVSEWSSTSSFTAEISGSTNLNNVGLEGININ